MKRVLALISQVGFNDKELLIIKKTLEKHNISCPIASFALGECIGKYGNRVTARFAFPKIDIEEFDGIFFVGGYGMASLMEYPQIIKLVKKADRLKKIIGGHCMAPALVLAKAGILKGKKVTVFRKKDGWSEEEIIRNGGMLVDAKVVVDKNIVTGRDEEDAQMFAYALIEAISDNK